MLLGKPQDKFEVYNDLDGELYNLFCVIKDRLPEFLLELDLLPMNARDNFKECLRFYNGGNDPGIHLPTQEEIIDRLIPQEWGWALKETMRKRVENRPVRQAAAFFTRMRTSYASQGISFACQPFSIRTTFEQIREMNQRIEDVVIENQSFEVLIPHYDRPDSFFYLDPPYVASEHFYEAEFGWEQHVRLRDILAGIKGKFLLSQVDCPENRYLYKDFDILDYTRAHTMAHRTKAGAQFGELLIGNYDLLERERQKPEQMSLAEMMGLTTDPKTILKERILPCKNRTTV